MYQFIVVTRTNIYQYTKTLIHGYLQTYEKSPIKKILSQIYVYLQFNFCININEETQLFCFLKECKEIQRTKI